MSFRREGGVGRGVGGWVERGTRVGNYRSGQGECGMEAYERRESRS